MNEARAGQSQGRELDQRAAELVTELRGLRARAHDDADAGAEARHRRLGALLDELRTLADTGRSACTDAFAGALLEAQIRAFERGDKAEAWRCLDELRARLHGAGAPDILHDRLAAALYNTHRGGELLADPCMRLAALEELQTRAYGDPSAGACRVALAELLADRQSRAAHRGEPREVELAHTALARLLAHDRGVRVARELARALGAQLLAGVGEREPLLLALRELADRFADQALLHTLAEALVIAHARALRELDEPAAARFAAELRTLAAGDDPSAELLVALGKLLHDQAVFGFDDDDDDDDALTALRELGEAHRDDLELRALLLSALSQRHRLACERGDEASAAALLEQADAALVRHELVGERRDSARAGLDAALRIDHLRMLMAAHALAGDRRRWAEAEHLLARARSRIDLAGSPVAMLEILGQMLVNTHVDANVDFAPDLDSDLDSDLDPDLDSDLDLGARALQSQRALRSLRELAQSCPHSPALQRHLATALFNAHVEASRSGGFDQAELLLAELEALGRDHPELLELRRRLVMTLVNHHGDVLEREDFTRANALLDRLRELVDSADADDHLRLQLAMALSNSLSHFDAPSRDQDGPRIIAELRVLVAREDASEALRALILDELSERFAPRQ